jgi:hypothetical protein
MQNIYSVESFLNRIEATENAKLGFWDFGGFEIESTEKYKFQKKISIAIDTNEITFINQRHNFIWSNLFFAFVVYLVLLAVLKINTNSFLNYILILGLIILSIALGIYLNILDKKNITNDYIIINQQGINIEDVFYSWDNIITTAVLIKYKQKNETNYLILGYNDYILYEMINLSKYQTSKHKGIWPVLTAYINYFKTENAKNNIS